MNNVTCKQLAPVIPNDKSTRSFFCFYDSFGLQKIDLSARVA